jgi:integrase
MKTKDRFRIIEFRNPKSVAFRVIGRKPDGTVVRENLKDYAHALARKQELEIDSINSPVVLIMQPTRLTTTQLRDAESAFHRLAAVPNGSTITVTACVDPFLKTGRSTLTQATVGEAFKAFVADKRKQNLRERTVLNLKSRVGNLAKRYGDVRVSDLTTKDIKTLIQSPDTTPVTFNSHRTVLHGFFQWCIQQDYCTVNPVRKMSPAIIERLEPTVLPLDKIKALLRTVDDFKSGTLAPYFSMALFCGLRPTELQRLGWESIDLENGLLTIRGAAAKLRARRVIELTPNVLEWLVPHFQKTPIWGANWRRDFDSVRRVCGFKGSVYRKKCDAALLAWPVDVLRHTAISYWQAHFKDEGACADRHGNSVETVHGYYRGLVRPQDAEVFWQLTPANLDAHNIITLPQVATAAA